MNDFFPDLFKYKPLENCLFEIKQQAKPNLELLVQLACLLEATAFKPGNVHPEASFTNSNYPDFVESALLVSPILSKTKYTGVGQSILNSVKTVNEKIGHNTNLGILLLMAPICAVPESQTLKEGVPQILNELTEADTTNILEAIVLSHPGGLGKVEEQDITEKPSLPFLELMKLAEHRDRIASEYCSGFSIILNDGIDFLTQFDQIEESWHESIIHLHLHLMSEYPDTLISRKCGEDISNHSAALAKEVLDSDWQQSESGKLKLKRFDQWLRADGHRRNPGTTADFVATILLASFRERRISIPKGH